MKPGYKQTDVGVIPEEWEVKHLGDICGRITTGKLDANKMVADGDYPFFTCARESYRIDKFAFDYEALLVSGNGANVGYVHHYNGKFNAYQRTYVISDFSADVQFLKLFLERNLHERIRVEVNAGNTPYITMGTLTEMVVGLPTSREEQRAIATALSDLDALLASLERLIAKKRDLKQAAMQQLLTGQTRLPGFKDEWVVKRLNELADIRSGGTPSTSVANFWDGNIPWCTPTDITALNGHKYLGETNRKITQLGLKASSAEMIYAHSIVMTSRATIGECAINKIPVSTNQGFKNFVPFETMDVEFLYYLLLTQKSGFISLCSGSTFLEIGKTQLVAYQVRLPSTKAEQTAIASVLSEMDAEVTALEQRRDKTRALKQGMMQELLTGRTRLV